MSSGIIKTLLMTVLRLNFPSKKTQLEVLFRNERNACWVLRHRNNLRIWRFTLM